LIAPKLWDVEDNIIFSLIHLPQECFYKYGNVEALIVVFMMFTVPFDMALSKMVRS